MLAIKNNLMAQSAARHLGKSYEHLSTSVERLSSGLRINSAKDDAAGLAVRELIRADVAALQQGSRNASDGVSMLQAAEGALGEIDAILIRMRELAEQASTGTYSSTQKTIMQNEYDELTNEVTRIATTTDFNEINLLQGTGAVEVTLGAGVSTNQTIEVDQQAMGADDLNLTVKTASAAGTYEEAILSKGGSAATAIAFSAGGAIAGGNAVTVAVSLNGETHNYVLGTGGGQTSSYTWQDIIDDFGTSGNAAAAWDTAAGTVKFTAGDEGDLTGTNAFSITTTGTAASDDVTFSDGATAVTPSSFSATDGSASTAQVSVSLTDGTVAQGRIDAAIETKDSFRAKLGYWMNRLEYAGSVLDVQSENLMAAESRISDVDVASEMSRMTRNQVLAQAGISMLAQANSMPQMALSLLQ